eukprot:2287419-Rhodomonas_salina.2
MVHDVVHPAEASPDGSHAKDGAQLEEALERPTSASSARSWSGLLDGFWRSMSFSSAAHHKVAPAPSCDKTTTGLTSVAVDKARPIGQWHLDDDAQSHRSFSSQATTATTATTVDDLLSARGERPASVARNLLSQEQLEDWKRVQEHYANMSSFHAPVRALTRAESRKEMKENRRRRRQTNEESA